jgi:hypothetical protein|eukprot:COSAG01_NODE_685_length_14250_cov_18.752032_2_plen_43_part_00
MYVCMHVTSSAERDKILYANLCESVLQLELSYPPITSLLPAI